MATRTCTACKVEKPATGFPAGRNQCRVCRTATQKAQNAAKAAVLPDDATRECKTCKVVKRVAEAFEAGRAECEACRQKAKTTKAKVATKDWVNTPKPARCAECGKGPTEVEFKRRDDVLVAAYYNRCTVCYNKKQYHVTCRQKKLAEDPTAYRAHNAAVHLAWAKLHPEYDLAYKTIIKCSPERKFKELVLQLTRKEASQQVCMGEASVPVDISSRIIMADKDMLVQYMLEPCFYCGYTPEEGGVVNGLDRVIPGSVYSAASTVPCCGICNNMKLTYTMDEFIWGMRLIAATHNYFSDDVDRPDAFGGRRAAPAVDKTNNLPIEVNINLWSGSCYLCGRAPALGIDRVVSLTGYVLENCKSCCSQCNYMKKDLDLDEFLAHVMRIVDYTEEWVLGDTRAVLSGTTGQRKPVAAVDPSTNEVVLIFPSATTAKRLLPVNSYYTLKPSTPMEYNAQKVDAATCKNVLTRTSS